MVHPGTPRESILGIRRQDRVGLERPDLAHEVLAQDQVVDERAVGHVQEGHALVADDVGGGALLAFPDGGELQRVHVRILTALVAAGAADEPALGALVDPARGGRRGPEIRVVGMGRDDHEPRRAPVVRRLRRSLGQAAASVIRAARAARSSASASSTSAAWPSALTFGQARAIRPSGSIRKVERTMPMYVLPSARLLAPRAVALDDLAVGVGQERERQLELLAEAPVARGAVLADAPDVRVGRGVVGVEVAELAGLGVAAGRVVLGVEVQDGPAAALVGEAVDRAGLVGKDDVGGLLARLRGRSWPEM